MSLEEYGESLAYDVAFWMQGLANPEYPIDQLGRLSLDVSTKFRALAILTLLVKGESDFFYHNLIRSGKSREAYLLRLRRVGITGDHHQASGRYEPLLDSIAAGDQELSRLIVSLSLSDFQQGHEYMDDYCYAQVLHRLVQDVPPMRDIAVLVSQFEAYQEGDSSPRLGVCRALAQSNQDGFEQAFDELLNEREAQIAADQERGELEEPHVIAQRRVFVEGLAILRLAELRGLKTEPEYRYCPSLARIPMKAPFPGE